MEECLESVLDKAGIMLWSSRDKRKGNLFLNLLEEYLDGICHHLSYSILTIKNDELVEVPEIPKESYSIHKTYELEDQFQYYIPYSEDNRLIYDTLNEKEIDDKLFIPLKHYGTSLALVIVEEKNNFLKLISLKNGKDIYDECPLLLEILLQNIEKRKLFEQYRGITNKYNTIKHTSVVHDIVSSVFASLEIPEISEINTLANTSYEKQENKGFLDFVYSDDIKYDIEFICSDSYDLSNLKLRYIRKLLEMTKSDMHLLVERNNKDSLWGGYSDCWRVAGLGTHDDNDKISFNFIGSSSWEMNYKSEQIIYNGMDFSIKNINTIEKNKYEDKVKYFYKKNKSSNGITELLNLIEVLQNQEHGTMLIVTPDAKQEAERLCKANRGIKIMPINLAHAPEKALNLSNIDGAVLIDLDCVCYAIGVIIDGIVDSESSFEGDPGRGARYNSAMLYLNNISENRIPCTSAMIIVFSEDGNTDTKSSFAKKRKNSPNDKNTQSKET